MSAAPIMLEMRHSFWETDGTWLQQFRGWHVLDVTPPHCSWQHVGCNEAGRVTSM